ncbi:inovirus Gp2 family protein [Acinetobacter sp. Tr-809]|uniref:YagK/YfjJ domain-containing protein n=1 Tax=Acinetobacter sp. Tr-809 TaxID=2608324 RepID=UPI0014248395|nr:inovirus-type Gp2 protein [Acinetobacter sp. Tr-809]NIE96999.1 inovirus Gp2 family protein [Acinetobacter sp. Tr-809]
MSINRNLKVKLNQIQPAHEPLAHLALFNQIKEDQQLVTYSDDAQQALIQCHSDYWTGQIIKAIEIVLKWQDREDDVIRIREHHLSPHKVVHRLECDQETQILLRHLGELIYYVLPTFLIGGVEWSAFESARSQLTSEEIEVIHLGGKSLHPEDQSGLECYVKLVNQFALSIRRYMRGPIIKRKLRDRAANCQENKSRCIELTKSIFDNFSKVLVVRLDFALKRDPETLLKNFYRIDEIHSKDDLAYLKKCIQKLLEMKRYNHILKEVIGYIFRFEYSVRTGFHVHCYLYFDGNKHRQDISLAQGIAEIWNEEITKGQGTTYICNMQKDSYRRCAIGMIHHSDKVKQEYLFQTFDYICKADQFFIFTNIKGARRFQSSEILGEKSKLGRPRKKTKSSTDNTDSTDNNMEQSK